MIGGYEDAIVLDELVGSEIQLPCRAHDGFDWAKFGEDVVKPVEGVHRILRPSRFPVSTWVDLTCCERWLVLSWTNEHDAEKWETRKR